jgi:hypothetical protein
LVVVVGELVASDGPEHVEHWTAYIGLSDDCAKEEDRGILRWLQKRYEAAMGLAAGVLHWDLSGLLALRGPSCSVAFAVLDASALDAGSGADPSESMTALARLVRDVPGPVGVK